LAELRRARGWSQRRLAAAAGVSHAYVALLERGRLASPGLVKLDALAHALGARSTEALVTAANAAPTPTADLPHDSTWSNVDAAVADGSSWAQAQRLPVYRWGSCGDPRDRDSPPDPDHLEYPPLGRESLIGPHGFGVMVKGDSMAGRGIYDGDVVWINPDRAYQVGKVVLALVRDAGGAAAGMVVKTFARTELGDCLMSEPDSGRTPVLCAEFKIIGPVVGITSWRLPT
jgi:SOS-response transcriptional repressor LexA